MNILALESSATSCSAALCRDGELLAQSFQCSGLTHSRTLLPMVNDLLKNCGQTLEQVDVIAVAAGPGSFTGLRIGSATAKGLGLALEKPIIPVPTVDALAYQMYGTDKLICPIMDARRSQVYTGLYEFVKNTAQRPAGYDLQIVKKQCATAVSEIIRCCNAYDREVIFLGDGVPVFAQTLADQLTVPYSFAPVHRRLQSAAAVGVYGCVLYRQGIWESAAAHRPEYLRMSQAERERLEREQKAETHDS